MIVEDGGLEKRLQHFIKSMDVIYAEMKAMLIEKHLDYGEENLRKHGLHGIKVRLDDKSARWDNLEQRTAMVKSETMRDTIVDIAGYCFQAVFLMNEDCHSSGVPCHNCRKNKRVKGTVYCEECIKNVPQFSHIRAVLYEKGTTDV